MLDANKRKLEISIRVSKEGMMVSCLQQFLFPFWAYFTDDPLAARGPTASPPPQAHSQCIPLYRQGSSVPGSSTSANTTNDTTFLDNRLSGQPTFHGTARVEGILVYAVMVTRTAFESDHVRCVNAFFGSRWLFKLVADAHRHPSFLQIQMLELTRLVLLAASALFCNAAFAEAVNSSADSFESNSAAAIAASGACQQLQRALGASIVQSKSSGPEYSLAANAAWSAFNHEVNFQPTCIVFVKSTAHVQTAMRAIYQNNADYAVQSGGHSGMTGWNT